MTPSPSGDPIVVHGHSVAPGRRVDLELPVSRLPTGSTLSLPLTVVNGRYDGPRVWLSAAVHGDELNGIESVRQVLEALPPKTMRGSIVAAPAVNVFGVLSGKRYLPDRRDLNRSFPGSARGSLAARLAHLLMTAVVEGCNVGIDLHTGSNHRDNYPQIRANLDDPETLDLAIAFGAPLYLHSPIRDGSLRGVATGAGSKVLVYEAGEALRFDHAAIELGTAGVLRVLRHLDMIDEAPPAPSLDDPQIVRRSKWIRGRRGGLMRTRCVLGQLVEEDQMLATISDAAGGRAAVVRAPYAGWVIGMNRNPLVNRGDALFHLGARE